MKHWHIYLKWNERLFMEMYNAYLDGRSDKDPSKGWYGGEIWFFDNWIIALAGKLRECGVFGVSSDEYLKYAQKNRKEWELKGHELTEGFIARAAEMAEQRGIKVPTSMESVIESVDECSEITELTDITELDEKEFQEGAENEETLGVDLLPGDVIENGLREIYAPPGKLGVVIDCSMSRPIVEQIDEDSPLKDTLAVGDCIDSVDGVDTARMNEEAFAALLGVNSHEVRKLVVRARSA
jgi:hypothetical protein